jgi:hypothetical protein
MKDMATLVRSHLTSLQALKVSSSGLTVSCPVVTNVGNIEQGCAYPLFVVSLEPDTASNQGLIHRNKYINEMVQASSRADYPP